MSVRHLVLAGALALPVLLAPQVGGPIGFTARVDAAQAASIAERAPIATQPPEAWADADPADSLYRQARELLNRGSYKRAAALFEEITRRHPTSAYAGDALYWRAFALYRSGGDDDLREALVALEAQRARYPRATATPNRRRRSSPPLLHPPPRARRRR